MSNIKQRLYAGEHLLGTMITTFTGVDIPKIMQACGFDYIVIDCEHGAFTTREVADMIAVSRSISLPVIVRIPELRREHALRFMEMGANGLLLPNTETVEQAQLLVDYAKYAPMGHRGVSLSRPHTDFKPVSGKTYMPLANEENILMCQIESRAGVEHVEQILSVEGIDIALIGPNDLSQDYGILGQFTDPMIVEAFHKVMDAAKKHGKFSGVHFGGAAPLLQWKGSSMSMNMWNSDVGLLMAGAKMLSELREV